MHFLFLVVLVVSAQAADFSEYVRAHSSDQQGSVTLARDFFAMLAKQPNTGPSQRETLAAFTLQQLAKKPDYQKIDRLLKSGWSASDLYIVRDMLHELAEKIELDVRECVQAFDEYAEEDEPLALVRERVSLVFEQIINITQLGIAKGIPLQKMHTCMYALLQGLLQVKGDNKTFFQNALVTWMISLFPRIKHEQDQFAWWNTLEKIALTAPLPKKECLIWLGTYIKALYKPSDTTKKPIVIIPSLRYCIALTQAGGPLRECCPDSMVDAVFEKGKELLLEMRRAGTYDVRFKTTGAETTPYYVAYDFLRDVAVPQVIVAVLGKDGWTSEIIEILQATAPVFDAKTEHFKRPLILVPPYFNERNESAPAFTSDFITLALCLRSQSEVHPEKFFRIIPLYAPLEKDVPGPASIAVIIGKGKQKLVISHGAMSVTYQTLLQSPDVKGELIYEPYVPGSEKHTSYLSQDVYAASLVNQPIQNGTPEDMWKALSKPQFLYGGINPAPDVSYVIQRNPGGEIRLMLSLGRLHYMRDVYGFALSASLNALPLELSSQDPLSLLPFGLVPIPHQALAVFACDTSGKKSPQCQGIVVKPIQPQKQPQQPPVPVVAASAQK